MAIITNTVTSFSGSPGLAGIREDLSDMIYNVSPQETPFVNGIGREKITSTLHEWQTDSFAAAATNAQFQGDDLGTTGFDAVVPTVRLNNRTQISRKSAIVDNTVLALNLAGRRDEMSFQVAKKSIELKRDIEKILVGTNQAKVTGAAATAPLTASVLSWIKTNTNKGTGAAADPTGDGTDARTDGTTRAYTEDLLQTVLQSQWSNSGEDLDAVMLGGTMKQTMSAFAGNNNRQIDAKGKAVFTSIDVYNYDFGSVKVVPNRFMRSTEALLLDYSKWALGWLRPISSQTLAPTGDAQKRLIIGEYCLVARNEKSSGIIADLA